MADKAGLWERMTARHGLRPIPYDQLVAWPFADYVFNSDWDVVSDLTRCRQHGFHRNVDTHEMLDRLLRQFRASRIVP